MVQMRMDGFKKVRPVLISEETQRVIEKDDSSSTTTSDLFISGLSKFSYENPNNALLSNLAHILNTTKMQIFIICLIILDVVFVVTSILITANVVELYGRPRNTIPYVLHCLSLSLLAIFLIEILFKVISMKLEYFKSKMEVFDGIVVIATLSLEIILWVRGMMYTGVGMLILLRLWRITKILNEIILSVKIQADRKLRHERSSREVVERELSKFRQYCQVQDREINALHELLRSHGIMPPFVPPFDNPPVLETISVIAEVNNVTEGNDIDLIKSSDSL